MPTLIQFHDWTTPNIVMTVFFARNTVIVFAMWYLSHFSFCSAVIFWWTSSKNHPNWHKSWSNFIIGQHRTSFRLCFSQGTQWWSLWCDIFHVLICIRCNFFMNFIKKLPKLTQKSMQSCNWKTASVALAAFFTRNTAMVFAATHCKFYSLNKTDFQVQLHQMIARIGTNIVVFSRH